MSVVVVAAVLVEKEAVAAVFWGLRMEVAEVVSADSGMEVKLKGLAILLAFSLVFRNEEATLAISAPAPAGREPTDALRAPAGREPTDALRAPVGREPTNALGAPADCGTCWIPFTFPPLLPIEASSNSVGGFGTGGGGSGRGAPNGFLVPVWCAFTGCNMC
jgi:hypothetical protein